MDVPRLQYARTEDGLNIAYLDMGSGPPIVFASHIYGDAHLYQVKGWYPQTVADGLQQAGWRVVMHDVRGMGLSDKPVADVSLTARVKDLQAVIAQLGLQRFVLLGGDHGAATAVAYAARNAGLISQLILVEPYALGSEKYAVAAPRLMGAVAAATDEEWRMWANVVAEIVTGFRAPELSRRLGAAIRSSTTPDQLRAYFRQTESIDIRDDLARVEAPTLVVSTGLPVGSLPLCRDVATRVANSSFVTLGTGSTWEVIDRYLRSFPQPLPSHSATRPAGDGRISTSQLSRRQAEVLRLIAAGKTNREIADNLVLSLRTVERHVADLYDKLGVRNRSEAVALAIIEGPT
jgi:pimeloyl-ACP methyl ester carboxylesterase/DNA-binding CsgD family transcriptional regulator